MKQVIKDCVVCKKAQVRPLRIPEPPDLPSYRLSNDFTFSNTGIDFGGQLNVKKKLGTLIGYLNVISVYLRVELLAMFCWNLGLQ